MKKARLEKNTMIKKIKAHREHDPDRIHWEHKLEYEKTMSSRIGGGLRKYWLEFVEKPEALRRIWGDGIDGWSKKREERRGTPSAGDDYSRVVHAMNDFEQW